MKEETKVNCRQANKRISMLIDGLLSKNGELKLLEHINVCPECKKLYEDTKEMVGRLNILPELPLPQGAENRVHFALERETQKPHNKNWFKFVAIAMPATAAAFAAVLGITYLFSGGLAGRRTADEATMEQMAITSESEESSMLKQVPENFIESSTFESQAEQPKPDEDTGQQMAGDEYAEDGALGTRALPPVTEFTVSITYSGESLEQMNEFVSSLVGELEGDPEQDILFDSQRQSAIVLLSIDRYGELIDMLKDSELTEIGEQTYDKDTAYDKNLLFEAVFLFQEQN